MSTDAEIDEFLEHFGVRGMKWGVRKSPAQRAARTRTKDIKRNEKKERNAASKLTKGEVVTSALLGGPIGFLTYRALKRDAARTKQENRNKPAAEQAAIAKKITLGEAVVVGMLTTPVGLLGYAAGKSIAGDTVKAFKPKKGR